MSTFNLDLAMVQGLIQLGYPEDQAKKLWDDVRLTRSAIRQQHYEALKFKRVTFPYYGLTLKGTVFDVRIAEDRGVEVSVDVGATKVWVRADEVKLA